MKTSFCMVRVMLLVKLAALLQVCVYSDALLSTVALLASYKGGGEYYCTVAMRMGACPSTVRSTHCIV